MASKCQKFDNLLFRNTSQEREDILFKTVCFFSLKYYNYKYIKNYFCTFVDFLDHLIYLLFCPDPYHPAQQIITFAPPRGFLSSPRPLENFDKSVIIFRTLIIIIMNTRPKPAFGRLGLGGSSRGYASNG